MPKKFTHEDFLLKVKIKHPDIKVLGTYINYNTKIKALHETCGYEWDATPDSLMYGVFGCPRCGNAVRYTQEEFEAIVKKKNPRIKIIGEYKSIKDDVKCKCDVCGGIYDMRAGSVIRGDNCQYCTSKKVLIGFNDIMTTAPWMAEFFADKNDALKYTRGSHERIKLKCPDCGEEKDGTIKSLYNNGFRCDRCSDKISYPNKFARAMLEQLPVSNLNYEYKPRWADYKIYDNYFEVNNKKYVLEMDGEFHYSDRGYDNRTVEEAIEVDKLKDRMCEEHDINMIRIESRKSDMDYLSNNILNSELSRIFDLSNINWKYCATQATKNIHKEICTYYEENKYKYSSKEIANHFHIHIATFYNIRKRGVEYGWCTHSKEEESILRSIHGTHPRAVQVYVYDSNYNFIYKSKTCNGCATYMNHFYNGFNFSITSIKNYCDKQTPYKGFYFFTDPDKIKCLT